VVWDLRLNRRSRRAILHHRHSTLRAGNLLRHPTPLSGHTRSTRITRLHRYYETVRPPAPHRYSAPHRFRCLGCSLSPTTPTHSRHYRGEAFPRSTPAPEPNSRHLHAGHHQGSKQVSPWLIPGQQLDPGFDVIDTLSTLQQWFTHVRLLGSHLTHLVRLFRHAHHHGSFTAATDGGLRPPPAKRPRRTNLHHQCSTATLNAIFYIATSSCVRGTLSSA